MVRRLSLFLAAVIVLLAAFGCGRGQDSPAAGDGPDTIIVGLSSDILTLDPANYRHRNTETVIRNIFDGLVTRTPEGEVVAEIAESWRQVSPTTWEFKLRQGVTFHNGDPLTADDVVFSFRRTIEPGGLGDGESSPRKGLIEPLIAVTKIDDYTVQFELEHPWPVFLQALVHHQIVPQKYVEQVGSREFARKPIGAGPFMFVEGDLNARIVLERYDGYYGGSPDLPPVGPAPMRRAIFDVLPEEGTRVTALKAGQVHIIHQVPSQYVPDLEADPNIQVKTAPGTRQAFLSLNVARAPLDDVRVRRAIAHAIDWKLLVDQVFGGMAEVMGGRPFLEQASVTHPDLAIINYDPNLTRSLLADAGYADGFDLVIDTEHRFQEPAEAVADMLKAAGIRANVRIWEWGALRDRALDGERSVIMSDWGNSYLHPYGVFEPLYWTDGRGNYSQYANAELDRITRQADSTVDEAEAAALYRQGYEIAYRDLPYIFGYAQAEIEAAHAGVQGWRPSTDSRINLHRVRLAP